MIVVEDRLVLLGAVHVGDRRGEELLEIAVASAYRHSIQHAVNVSRRMREFVQERIVRLAVPACRIEDVGIRPGAGADPGLACAIGADVWLAPRGSAGHRNAFDPGVLLAHGQSEGSGVHGPMRGPLEVVRKYPHLGRGRERDLGEDRLGGPLLGDDRELVHDRALVRALHVIVLDAVLRLASTSLGFATRPGVCEVIKADPIVKNRVGDEQVGHLRDSRQDGIVVDRVFRPAEHIRSHGLPPVAAAVSSRVDASGAGTRSSAVPAQRRFLWVSLRKSRHGSFGGRASGLKSRKSQRRNVGARDRAPNVTAPRRRRGWSRRRPA